MSKFQKPNGVDVAVRVILAVLGGYGLATSFGLMLSFALQVSRDDAIMYASIFSFLVMALAVMWVFAVPKWWQALLGLIACNSLFASFAWIAKVMEFNG